MDLKKWKDWRLNALNEQSANEELATMADSDREWVHNVGQEHPERAWINSPNDAWYKNPFYNGPKNPYPPHPEDYDESEWEKKLDESFYHLNREAKLGFSIRQMRKHLSEIEKSFKRTVESGKIDDMEVENWAKTYQSLKMLDERLHGLMKQMYKGK